MVPWSRLLVFSIFILPSHSLTPNKDKRRDAYAPWINPPTPEEDVKIIVVVARREERKETWQLMADQAGEQYDPRSTQRLYSKSCTGKLVESWSCSFSGNRSTPGGEKNAKVFYRLFVASGNLAFTLLFIWVERVIPFGPLACEYGR